MATTTIDVDYVLNTIENLNKHVEQRKLIKREGFLQREKVYNDKRKWVSWLVEPYDNTWEGIADENNYYYYADDELEYAEKLKALIRLSPNGQIMIDEDDAAMIEWFDNLKVED